MIQKRFIQIASIALLYSVSYLCSSSVPITIIAMTSDKEPTHFNWNTEQISLITNAFLLFFTLSIIPMNYLPKFVEPTVIMYSSVLGIGTIYLAIPFVAQYGWWCMYLIQAMIGVFSGAYAMCSLNMISKWAPLCEKTRLMTVVLAGKTCGSGIGASAAGIIIENCGWQYVFIFYGLITCFTSICMKFVLVGSPNKHPTITAKELSLYENYGSNEKIENFIHPPWCDMLKSPAIWAISSCIIVSEYASTLLYVQIPLYVKNVIQMDIKETGFFVSVPQTITWLGIAISWVADYLIKQGVRVVVVRKIMTSFSFCGWAVIIELLFWTKNPLIVLLVLCLGEIFRSALSGGSGINNFDIAPTFVGAVTSIQALLVTPVYLIGPLISGYILQDLTDEKAWHNLFLIAMVSSFIANIIYLTFAEGEPQKWDPMSKCKPNDNKRDRTNSA